MSAVDLYSRGIRDALDLVRQLRVRVVTEERKARGRYRAERALVKAAGVRLATTRAPPVATSSLARIQLLGHPYISDEHRGGDECISNCRYLGVPRLFKK